jgi:hypothetical protein
VATSEAEICNLALGAIGSSKGIASLTEASTPARACKLNFAQVRDEVLEAFPWPFATVIDTLGLVATAPNSEWAYSYRYPAGALTFRRILSGTRNDTPQTRVAFKHGQDTSGRLLFTDRADAEGEWTVRITDVARFSPAFVAALAYKLAAAIAPQVTGGDPYKLGLRALQRYAMQIAEAKAAAANEEQPDLPPESETILARY